MTDILNFIFTTQALPTTGTIVHFVAEGASHAFAKEADIADFKGKAGTILDVLNAGGYARVFLYGLGKEQMKHADYAKLGGKLYSALPKAVKAAHLDLTNFTGAQAAEIALGLRLKAYDWDRLKTKKKDDEKGRSIALTLHTRENVDLLPNKALRMALIWQERLSTSRQMYFFQPEFAARARELTKLGVDVEVLGEAENAQTQHGRVAGCGAGVSS